MDSIKSTKERPLIIAHRGYSSLLPQNTFQSIEAAIYKSDLVQFDILLTRDRQVVIFHDRYLGRLTNVSNFQEYKNRKRIAKYDIEQSQSTRQEWWLHDFTYKELSQLNVKQAFENRPQFKSLNFKIPTLQSALRQIVNIKKQRLRQNKCGFLIEIKSLWQHQDDEWDEILVQKLVQILRANNLYDHEKCRQQNFPIIIQSFNHKILDLVSKSQLRLPIVHLFDKTETLNRDFIINKSVKNMIGIGITQKHATQQIKKLCDSFNYLLFYWTLRDDQIKIIPFQKQLFKQVYMHLLEVGISGFITEFPQKCQQYINEYLQINSG